MNIQKYCRALLTYFERNVKCSNGLFSVYDHPYYLNDFDLDYREHVSHVIYVSTNVKHVTDNVKHVNNVPNDVPMDVPNDVPLELRILYSNIEPTMEMLFPNNWVFLSPFTIEESKYDHSYFVDIAVQHQGQGRLCILSYYPEKHKYFTRRDGGSSYEILDFQEYYQDYIPKDVELYDWKFIKKKLF